jgi:hypothetical protein
MATMYPESIRIAAHKTEPSTVYVMTKGSEIYNRELGE